MATSEEVFELIEQTSTRLLQFKTVLSLAHDASDAGLTAEEVVLHDRVIEAQNHFHVEPVRAHRSPLRRFLPKPAEVQDLTKLENELEQVQVRRPQDFDVKVFAEPEVEQMQARRASHAVRPFVFKSLENRQHYALHLEDAQRMFLDCAEGVLRLSAIFDSLEDAEAQARNTRLDFEQIIDQRGRLPLADLDGLYEDTEASFIEAAERLGYDRHGNRTQLGDISLDTDMTPKKLMREHLDRADDSSQSVVFAAFKPIHQASEPTPILVVLDLDDRDPENPMVIGQRGLVWGETAVMVDAKTTLRLDDLMGHKTEFDNDRVGFGVQHYGGAAMTVPGFAARIAEASTGTLDNSPAYKHLAGKYFSELRNVASGSAHREGNDLSTMDPIAFGERILDAHAQVDLAKDTLINNGPGFGR